MRPMQTDTRKKEAMAKITSLPFRSICGRDGIDGVNLMQSLSSSFESLLSSPASGTFSPWASKSNSISLDGPWWLPVGEVLLFFEEAIVWWSSFVLHIMIWRKWVSSTEVTGSSLSRRRSFWRHAKALFPLVSAGHTELNWIAKPHLKCIDCLCIWSHTANATIVTCDKNTPIVGFQIIDSSQEQQYICHSLIHMYSRVHCSVLSENRRSDMSPCLHCQLTNGDCFQWTNYSFILYLSATLSKCICVSVHSRTVN